MSRTKSITAAEYEAANREQLDWGNAVYDAIGIQADVSRGDAQAIAEGQQSVFDTAWALRALPADAAAAILQKAEAP